MDKILTSVMAIITGIIGVAIIAALVSTKSQTPQLLSSAGGAFAQILNTALSPINGSSTGLTSFGGFTGLGAVGTNNYNEIF